MTHELGNFLKLKRGDKSLRSIEEETGISNAYLSQLERGVAKKPSPSILYRLSECYGCSYLKLMELAGYVRMSNKPKEDPRQEAQIALMSSGLSKEQVEQVMDYVDFLKTKEG